MTYRKFGSDVQNLVKQKSSNHIVLKSRSFSFDGKSKAPSHITKKISLPIQNDHSNIITINLNNSVGIGSNCLNSHMNINVREIVRNHNLAHNINRSVVQSSNANANLGSSIAGNHNCQDKDKNKERQRKDKLKSKDDRARFADKQNRQQSLNNNVKQTLTANQTQIKITEQHQKVVAQLVDKHDQQLIPIYLSQCLTYLKSRQKQYNRKLILEQIKQKNPKYLAKRSQLVDWMVCLHGYLKLFPQTLFIAVWYMDLYFSRTTTKNQSKSSESKDAYNGVSQIQQNMQKQQKYAKNTQHKYQQKIKQKLNEEQQPINIAQQLNKQGKDRQFYLVSATCLLIAGKFEQTYRIPYIKNIQQAVQLVVEAHANSTKSEKSKQMNKSADVQTKYTPKQTIKGWSNFTKQQIINMEERIIQKLGFTLIVDTPIKYIELFKKFGNNLNIISEKNHFIAQYILQLSLLQSPFIQYSQSLISSAVLYLVNKIRKVSPAWPTQLQILMGYQQNDLKNCAKNLCAFLQKSQTIQCANNIRIKYSKSEYSCASNIKLQRKSQ